MRTTARRRALLRRLLSKEEIGDQATLIEKLAAAGHPITQATISRDLTALGVEKRTLPDGRQRYVLPRSGAVAIEADGDQVAAAQRFIREFLVDVGSSGNLVVLRTVPGTASTVAEFLDRAHLVGVLGSIAGDDTIFLATTESNGGAMVEAAIRRLVEGPG
jgi:transcriptional regulator of arginine metabolism